WLCSRNPIGAALLGTAFIATALSHPPFIDTAHIRARLGCTACVPPLRAHFPRLTGVCRRRPPFVGTFLHQAHAIANQGRVLLLAHGHVKESRQDHARSEYHSAPSLSATIVGQQSRAKVTIVGN